MIIRKPTMLDIVKIAATITEEPTQQMELVRHWVQAQKSDSFIDFVAIKKKHIVGVIQGMIVAEHESVFVNIEYFKAASQEILKALWTKIKTVVDPDAAGLKTANPDLFSPLDFKPAVVVMGYTKQSLPNEAEQV